MADLISLALLRQVEAIGTGEETKWGRWIKAASAWTRNRLGFDPLTQSYAHRVSGQGRALLTLSAWPITAVASLVVDGEAWSVLTYATAADGQEEAYLDRNARWLEARNGRTFPQGSGNIYCAYTAGWATLPEDLEDVAINVTRLLGREQAHLGQGAVILGAEQVNEILRNTSRYETFMQTIMAYRLIP